MRIIFYFMVIASVALLATNACQEADPVFRTIYLQVHPEGNGEATGAGDHEVGKEVTIKATSLHEDVFFIHWTGDVDFLPNPEEAVNSFKMPDHNLLLTANFGTETISDIDGNEYQTVRVGDQIWMSENLKTTTYHNGENIPNETDWRTVRTGAFVWYEHNEDHKYPYGALYNWYAVSTGKLCPPGWRVPTADDWELLIMVAGGTTQAGMKLKEAGTAHWAEPNTGINETGYSALPGGYVRGSTNSFDNLTTNGYYWDFDEVSETEAGRTSFRHDSNHAGRRASDKRNGFSVRCLKE